MTLISRLPRRHLLLPLLLAIAVGGINGLLTLSVQASLFLCANLDEPCAFLSHHQVVLAGLNLPVSLLALDQRWMAGHEHGSWRLLNAGCWGVLTFTAAWLYLRLKRRGKTVVG